MVTMREHLPAMSAPAPAFSPERDLPSRFLAFYRPLHDAFAERQRTLLEERRAVLKASLEGKKPQGPAQQPNGWTAELPEWCRDQRDQLLVPSDDPLRIVAAMNAGGARIVLDLEDALANTFDRTIAGIDAIVKALYGELTAVDDERPCALWTRVRGLHLSQAGIVETPTPAPLFDLALLAYRLDVSRLAHAPAIVIPKAESAAEGAWWREVLAAIAAAKGQPSNAFRAIAILESFPLVHQLAAFAWELREQLVGLAYDPVDYAASFAHYNLERAEAVLPDRGAVGERALFDAPPAAVVAVAHAHGLLAIGPRSSAVAERPVTDQLARALEQTRAEKQAEAAAFFDGGWTSTPEHGPAAAAAFPAPNQIARQVAVPELAAFRPSLAGAGPRTIQGTRSAVKTAIRYRHASLAGRGSTVIDGQLETLDGDRLSRLMIAQRFLHGMHKANEITRFFDEELARLLVDPNQMKHAAQLREARRQAEEMVRQGFHNPI